MKLITAAILLLLIAAGCEMSKQEQIDNIFTDYDKPKVPGAAVMLIREGKIIFQKGYGLADVENNLPVTANTNFRLASVTKQFTAMCILKLIEDNKLNMSTTLTEIFPDFPVFGNKITIKNLLQHTSGLIDYEDLIDDTVTVQVKDQDVLNMIMKTDSTYFEPGSQHRYSNTGFALLALTIEKISGMHFRDFLSERIFKPLEMNGTLAFENGINEVNNRAYGYTIADSGIEFTDQSVTSAVLGDGGIYSSLDDLYKWDQALYTDKLIGRKFLQESWTSGITSEGDEFQYGYGWRLETYKNMKVVYHTGSTRGFRNIIYRIPEKKFTIVILTNRNSGSEMITLDLAHRLTEIFFPN